VRRSVAETPPTYVQHGHTHAGRHDYDRDVALSVITGSAGLIGSEAARHFSALGLQIIGIDNDQRSRFFGSEASTRWNRERLEADLGSAYVHHDIDIRDRPAVDAVFSRYARDVEVVIHAAAQPSHDWAAREPLTDFDINAVGTANVLEATRLHAPEAVFIFTSTNKVYGDTPNRLPLVELDTRFEIQPGHPYEDGIREDMSIDTSLHSIFGASKVAADVLVQEYGRYFGMSTACFRGGTLTGADHSATELHGFLAYVMKCTLAGTPYRVYGYGGKQVRDVIDGSDVIRAFECFWRRPKVAAVYNIGGGRTSNASVIEAIQLCQEITGRELDWTYDESNRIGDHIWWIGSNAALETDFPEWRVTRTVADIAAEMFDVNATRWTGSV
jgi:CDP-paratose 2-epimerase